MTAVSARSRGAWLLLALAAVAALAVGASRTGGASTPQERIDAIARTIKCPVCPAESVYESRNSVALNVKAEIARRVRAGETNNQIRSGLAARYGEGVLLVPKASGIDAVVWVLPVVVLMVSAAGLLVAFGRWRRYAAAAGAPTAEDRELVARALHDREGPLGS